MLFHSGVPKISWLVSGSALNYFLSGCTRGSVLIFYPSKQPVFIKGSRLCTEELVSTAAWSVRERAGLSITEFLYQVLHFLCPVQSKTFYLYKRRQNDVWMWSWYRAFQCNYWYTKHPIPKQLYKGTAHHRSDDWITPDTVSSSHITKKYIRNTSDHGFYITQHVHYHRPQQTDVYCWQNVLSYAEISSQVWVYIWRDVHCHVLLQNLQIQGSTYCILPKLSRSS